MADTKQYLDYAGLVEYDAKIKGLITKEDGTTLASAKNYADSLASNYDAAGSAASALTSAKAYADGKDAAIQAAQTAAETAQGAAEAAQTSANDGIRLAGVAQGDIDKLEAYVGEFTHATAKSVVEYIDAKTDGIATDTALTALTGRVTAAEGEIDAIQADYLKDADKQALATLINQEVQRAEKAEGDIIGRLEEVETFFETTEGETLNEALDTLVELQKYLDGEGKVADQMLLDIAANKAAIEKEVADRGTAISGVETAYKAADEAIDARLKAVEAELGDGEGSVAEQIAAAVAAEAKLRDDADKALDVKIGTAQSAADKAQGEVDALEGVVATLTETVGTKAAASDLTALAGRVTTAEGEIDALQADTHTHSNKGVIDNITAQLVSQWNEAYEKAHTHTNAEVLAGITSAKIAAWDAAESNAKSYTDGRIAEFTPIELSVIDGLFTATV